MKLFLFRKHYISDISLKILTCIDPSNPPTKLIEHCNSLNTAYDRKHYTNCAIIIRAILDYIPTIFGYESNTALLSQISKNTTFKKALEELNISIRNIANDALHRPAEKHEFLNITKSTIDNQQGNLRIIIQNVITQLETEDLRDKGWEKIKLTQIESSHSHKSNFEEFMRLITDKNNWYKEDVNEEVIWINKKDNLYQIIERNDYSNFSEPWTQVYPDQLGSGKHSVDLVYNGNHIKRIPFIYCDGGRISVALPDTDWKNSKNIWEGKDLLQRQYKNVAFYWRKDSIEFKLTELIGNFYIYNDIYGIAKMSQIEIR